MPNSVKDHTTGIGKDLTFTSILGIKKEHISYSRSRVHRGELFSKNGCLICCENQFFKRRSWLFIMEAWTGNYQGKDHSTCQRCIKKDRVVGVLWTKKLISRSYSVNLTLFLLKFLFLFLLSSYWKYDWFTFHRSWEPFYPVKKDKKTEVKKGQNKKVFLRTNHIKMYLKYQGVSIMYHRWYLSSNSLQLETYC